MSSTPGRRGVALMRSISCVTIFAVAKAARDPAKLCDAEISVVSIVFEGDDGLVGEGRSTIAALAENLA